MKCCDRYLEGLDGVETLDSDMLTKIQKVPLIPLQHDECHNDLA